MTELSFLVELLLNHRLQKSTKDLIAQRIKEVEAERNPVQMRLAPQPQLPAHIAIQAPSTQAALLRQQANDPNQSTARVESGSVSNGTATHVESAAQPVAVVAQTPAAIAALASREAAISASLSGKVDKQSGRPRKF